MPSPTRIADVTVKMERLGGGATGAYSYVIFCQHGFLANGVIAVVRGEASEADVKLQALRDFGRFIQGCPEKPGCSCMEQASMRHGAEHETPCSGHIHDVYSRN